MKSESPFFDGRNHQHTCMKKKALLIAFIMLHLSLLQNANPSAFSVSTASFSTDLKILSWNIYMLPYLSLFNNSDERAKLIAEKLQSSDYQIIVFQEAFSIKCRGILSKALAKTYPFQYGPVNKNRTPFRTSSGLWVVSKIPLEKLGEIQFKASRGFDAVARKGAALFEGRFHGARFQLLATHLQAENEDNLRSEQCTEIREKLLNTFYSKDVPQILCGDFNIDRSDSKHYTQMLQTLDAANGELSGSVQVTYDEQDNNLAFRKNGQKRIIDYVLVRNENRLHRMERKVQTFLTRTKGRVTNLSDHYAMEVSLAFSVSEEKAEASDYLTLSPSK
jgi:endonuclease/exonuclease/phosphatase family metal-dependent hydrolase